MRHPKRAALALAVAAAAASTLGLVHSPAALATTGQWITNGSGNWNTGANWNGGTIPNAVSDIADFSTIDLTTAATVSLDVPVTLGTLTFGDTNTATSGTWRIEGPNTLTLAVISGIPAINVNDLGTSGSVTIGTGTLLAGNQGLFKLGVGTLVLASNSSYTGGTNLAGGILQVGTGGTSGSLGSGDVINNGTLAFNRSDAVVFSDSISGTGALTKAGTGTLSFNSSGNTYSGTTTINGGAIAYNNTTSFSSLANNSIVVNAGGAVSNASGAANDPTFLSKLASTSSGTLIIRSVDAATNFDFTTAPLSATPNMFIGAGFGDNVTYTAAITPSGNTYRLGGGFGTLQIANALTGAGNAVLIGPASTNGGTVIFQSNNTYGGTTTIAAGSVLQVGTGANTGTLGAGDVVGGNGTLTFSRTGLPANAFTVTNNIAVNQLNLSSGFMTTTGVITTSGTFNLSATTGARMWVNGGSLTVTGLGTIGNAALFFATGGTTAFNGGIRVGTSNDATFMQINGGAVQGTTLTIARSSNFGTGAAPNPATGSTTAGVYMANGSMSFSGNITIASSNSSASIRQDGGASTFAGNLIVGAQTATNRWSMYDMNGGTLTATGPLGVVIASDTASDHTELAEFNMRAGTANVVGFSFGDVPTLTAGTGLLQMNGGTLYVGTGGMVKRGSGTFAATVNLSGGVLGASGDSTSSANVVLLSNNYNIQAADSGAVAHNMTFTGAVSGTGSINKTGGGILDLQGTNSSTAATFATVNAGTLAGRAGSLRGGIVNNAALAFSDQTGSISTFTGSISGGGTVGKIGLGTSMLNSGQTYTGATSVSQGTLGLAGNFTSSTGVTVNNGAALMTRAGGASVSNLTFGATGTDAQTLFTNDGSGINTLTVTNNNGLTTNGTTTLDIGVSGLSVGTKVLIDYSGSIMGSGFGGFQLGTLPPRMIAALQNNVTNTSVDLNISGFDFPRWIGNVSGTWDINSTPNWKTVTGNTTTTYLQSTAPGDQVLFDDAPATNGGTGNVLIPGTVQPSIVTINNSTAQPYTFSGSGKISGVTPLIKNGNGIATISNTGGNDYTGGTTINNGTLQLGVVNALPAAGNITIAGGTLDLNFQGPTFSGNVALTGGTLTGGQITKNNGNYDLQAGLVDATVTLSGSAGVVKTGAGTVILAGGNHNYTGTTTVNAGTLQLGDGVSNNGSTPGIITNNATVDFNPGGQQIWTQQVVGVNGTVIKDGNQELIVNGVNDGKWVINSGQVTVIGPGGTSVVPRIGHSGSVTVNNGGLVLAQGGNGLGLSTGNNPPDWIVNTGGTIKADAAADLTLYNGTFAGGIITADPSYASLTFRGDYTVLGSTSSVVNAPGNLALFNAVQFTMQSNSQLTISSNLTNDTSAMVASGPGTLILSGNNTGFPGVITASAGGTIVVSDPTNLGGNASIAMNNGTFRMAASISDTHNVTLSTAAGGTLDTNGFDSTFSGAVTGTGNFTKAGAGVLLLNNSGNAWSGSTNATGGRLVLDQLPFLNTAGVNASNNAVIELTNDGSHNKVIRAGSVAVTGTAQVDLHDNKMIVTGVGATGTFAGTGYTGVTGLIASGRAGNAWTGSGIVTSEAAAHLSNFVTIGVALASDVRPATATATGLWAGQTITGTDTLIMYTYGGDATLDGKINVDDYIKIDSGIAAGLTGWSNGDFNYDGKVNIDDYTQFIDNNIGTQGPQFPTAGGDLIAGGGSPGVSAVPEPAMLSVIGLSAALGMMRRHRRRHEPRLQ